MILKNAVEYRNFTDVSYIGLTVDNVSEFSQKYSLNIEIAGNTSIKFNSTDDVRIYELGHKLSKITGIKMHIEYKYENN